MLRLRRYERLSVQNRRFRSNGGLLTQNFRKKGSPPANHSFSQETRINYLSYGIKILTYLSSILSQSTRLTDGRTDGQNSHRKTTSAFHAARYKLEIHWSTLNEGHFVLFAGHSSKSGVLGNGHSNVCINTFSYYRSTFKRHALFSKSCWSSGN